MAETVAERIARVIGERIVAGELAAGTPLRQDHIAEEFDASHVPAREAFQLLRAQGLVVSEPRRGMRVAPLDQASIQETVEIRAALETLALRLAAPRINAAAFERIELALAAGDQAKTIEEWNRPTATFTGNCSFPAGCRDCSVCSTIFSSQTHASYSRRRVRPAGDPGRAMRIDRSSTS